MKSRPASDYLSQIDFSAISKEDRRIVDERAAEMRNIDKKLFTLKGQRRNIADWFLSLPRLGKDRQEQESAPTREPAIYGRLPGEPLFAPPPPGVQGMTPERYKELHGGR